MGYKNPQLGKNFALTGEIFFLNEGVETGLVDLLVSLVATHLAEGVLQHHILLEEVVDRYLTLCIVVHRALQEEAQETLCAPTTRTCGQVTQQHQVEH